MSAIAPSRAVTWVRYEQAKASLARVLGALDSAGIEALPVKGIITAHALYDDPTERPFLDVDLRVRPRDLPRARAACDAARLTLIERSRVYRSLAYDVSGMRVELEAHVGPPGFCALSVASMIARATRAVAPFGYPHLEPELHDHALFLCVNAFKDKLRWAQPPAVRDLERIVAMPGFEAPRLAALARASGAATLVGVVAEWLVRTRGADRWREVTRSLGEPRRPRYARIFARVVDEARHDEALAVRVAARAAPDAAWRRGLSLGLLAAVGIERAASELLPGLFGGAGELAK